ncbi:MAG TPA: nicotinamide-nucleotide amidohydrolase family protein [Gammaproteobacteria bacterium]|nr:nicotinamide-nucleotide amidohydrolase family protein [Gammaproteobacteria bacterium]
MKTDDGSLQALAAEVGRRLKAAELTLATAESCTGGWIAKAMTDVAGSSEWFDRGYVTYSNAAKLASLGVEQGTLDAEGAVSEATVREMAAGAAQASGSRITVAVSGIAGPDGGSPDKPVGTVWIAWRWAQGQVTARQYLFKGDREAIRRATVAMALEGLRDGLP